MNNPFRPLFIKKSGRKLVNSAHEFQTTKVFIVKRMQYKGITNFEYS